MTNSDRPNMWKFIQGLNSIPMSIHQKKPYHKTVALSPTLKPNLTLL